MYQMVSKAHDRDHMGGMIVIHSHNFVLSEQRCTSRSLEKAFAQQLEETPFITSLRLQSKALPNREHSRS